LSADIDDHDLPSDHYQVNRNEEVVSVKALQNVEFVV
jgi:hypothetical protein